MRKKLLGHSGIEISTIVFGGWQAGKEYWVGIDDAESIAAHRAAFESGITTFDTAEHYGHGHSERILAQALADKRDELVIATKVSWDHLRAQQVIEACERSLKNLRTDRIDLYQIHWPAGSWDSELVPVEETLRALESLKQQGKIRAIGVSNFSRAQLEEALGVRGMSGVIGVDSLQPPYSLFFRQAEKDAMPLCVERGLSVMAYSPLAQGLLTGRFGRGHVFPEGDNRRDNKLFQGEVFDAALSALEELKPYAAKYRVTLAQLALAWLVAHPNVVVIAGARTAAQARENALAGELGLEAADVEAISAIGLRVSDKLGDSPMMWNW